MRTPKDFDYDLWTTEDGKNMVRVKATGEVTEVSRQVMLALRSFEMKLKRSQTGIPVESGNGERTTLLSIDLFSLDSCDKNSDGMTPPWLIDDEQNPEKIASLNELKKEFIESLTPAQKEIFLKCLYGGLSLRKFAKENSLSFSSVHDSVEAIRKKYFKVFDKLK